MTRNPSAQERQARPEPAGRFVAPVGPMGPRALSLRSPIAPRWWMMGVVFALVLAACALERQAGLSFIRIAPLLVAALLALSARWLAVLATGRTAHGARRLFIVGLVVSMPMFLCAYGLVRLAATGGPGWAAALATLLSVAGVAQLIQAGRRHVALNVHVPCLAGVVATGGSLTAWIALALSAIGAALVGQRQIAALRKRELAAEAEARAQRRAQELLRDFEEAGQGWFWETDHRACLTYLSPVMSDWLERPMETMVDGPFAELFQFPLEGPGPAPSLARHLSERSSFQDLLVRAAVGTGAPERWWSISGRPVHDGFGNFLGFRGAGQDLTERRRSQERASWLTQFDALTGLANRQQMACVLEQALDANEGGGSCAIFQIDLDRFKQVNESLGHPAGDWLLKQVAQRLQRIMGTRGSVGRLGGDEFQLIVPGKGEPAFLAELAGTIIEALSQPYLIEGHRVVTGASVGIAMAPKDGATSEALVRNADLALYAAKDGGRGRHHFYADDLHKRAEERRQLEQDLREAIASDQLELHYQPIVNAATEKISGFEALLRWNHPVLGHVPPSRFVQVAEDTGLIERLGHWALDTACRDLALLPDGVRIAVNVSPLQCANPRLPGKVADALTRFDVRPDRLELEITESVFLEDDANTEQLFAALKSIGARLALDDFGTGYSSLGYLRKAPFDKIKIDRSFVRGATEPGNRNGAIIAAITNLADALGMETTAEGVETPEELNLVRVLGCSQVQGYVYDKPMPLGAVLLRLEQERSANALRARPVRGVRHPVLRKVVLEHSGVAYNATIRNISTMGAMVVGLRNVPIGTAFTIRLSRDQIVEGVTRWCKEDRIGVEFVEPLANAGQGRLLEVSGGSRRDRAEASEMPLAQYAG